jgi:tyrosine-protein kinase Etk/Wzc
VDRAGGLSELIAGSIDPEAALHREILPHLDLITTGAFPSNPAELVVSPAFSGLVNQLSGAYDIVVIDTAPVLVAADTLSVANMAGTVVLVARAEQSQVGDLIEAERQLNNAGIAVNGAVVNGIDTTRRHYGSATYKYGAYKYRNYEYEPSGSR